jgi:hypothetical protein
MAILRVKLLKLTCHAPVLLALTRTSLSRYGDICQGAGAKSGASPLGSRYSSPPRRGVLDEAGGLADAVAPLDRGCGGGEPGVQSVVAE